MYGVLVTYWHIIQTQPNSNWSKLKVGTQEIALVCFRHFPGSEQDVRVNHENLLVKLSKYGIGNWNKWIKLFGIFTVIGTKHI